jgi:hypothetical protein
MLSGCAVYRGVDFGHWAGRAEDRALTQVYDVKPIRLPQSGESILVLPPMGKMDETYRSVLHTRVFVEAQQNIPARVNMLQIDRRLAEYVNEKNMVPVAGQFDFQEVGRVGRLLGASHVICIWVNKAIFNAPQNLDLYFAVVESEEGTVVAQMSAQFDASEQKVVIALNDYLQAYRAREFDRPNLDFIQRSPNEYIAFVANRSMNVLESALWGKIKVDPKSVDRR